MSLKIGVQETTMVSDFKVCPQCSHGLPDPIPTRCSQCRTAIISCSECDKVVQNSESVVCSECGDELCGNCGYPCSCDSAECDCSGYVCYEFLTQAYSGDYCTDCYYKVGQYNCHPFEVCKDCFYMIDGISNHGSCDLEEESDSS